MRIKSIKWNLLPFILAWMLLLSGCGIGTTKTETPATGTLLNVTVSILPEAYFVERIGGSYVQVNVMVEPGADPHVYEPKPEQMKNLSNSDLYLKIGVEFENVWMDKFASINPNMVIKDVSEGVTKIPVAVPIEISTSVANHDHEEGLDPHIWLSPERVKTISKNIYQVLVELDPANESGYKTNLDAFINDIETLQTSIQSSFADVVQPSFLVFHPAWGYFADEFHLTQVPVEVGGNEPSPKELAQVISLAKQQGIKVIFVSPQFSSRSAETIATEIGGQVLTIDPLAEDWLDNMQKVADTFNQAMK